MNIQSIRNFNLSNFNYFNKNNGQNNYSTAQYGVRMSEPLKADMLSFGSGMRISEAVEISAIQDMERLNRIAMTYLDILESIAMKLKDMGVSFDRQYCEKNPVKSPKSLVSKIKRSRKFSVPDRIRATLYLENPYNLSNLIHGILPELAKRGYVVAEVPTNLKSLIEKRGYVPNPEELKKDEIDMPDIDIRLNGSTNQLTNLSPEFKFFVGEPQKSGYEDIQIRLVREFEKRKNQLQHELIILFGPNYAEAKHLESELVYNNLRLFDELNFKRMLKEKAANNKNYVDPKASIINRYIELIQKMFTGKISQKLFENAKNKDFYKIDEQIPIIFLDEDIESFERYFKGLKSQVTSYYAIVKQKYKNRPDRVKLLTKEQKSDTILLNQIHDNLLKTIDFFNKANKTKSKNKN